MINTVLGIKGEMASDYDARGRRVAVTKVLVTPNVVTQIKTSDSDGYSAVQIGTGSKKSVRKPQVGHLKKAGANETTRWMREVRTDSTEGLELGQELNLGRLFRKGDAVKVSGTSKGKGFQGGVRRHGFHGGPKTHGQSDRHRAPGSIGAGTTPGRVYKGKRMAGHMGNEKASLKNLEVVSVDKENNFLLIKGAVPGPVGGLLTITKTGVIKGYTPPPEEKEEEEEVKSDVEQMEAGGGTVEEAKTEESPSTDAQDKGEENGG